MEEFRAYFKRHGADTRDLRRKYLYLIPNHMYAAMWLYNNPSDIWDTDEDERRGWTNMHADPHVEAVERNHADTGHYDEPEDRDDMHSDRRAQAIGRTRACQEAVFDHKWVFGNGVWEK